MLNFIPRDMLFALLFVMVGFGGGYIAKEYFFTKPCPDCICPECPPQTVLHINNEKIKAKGNGAIDLTSIIKDNNILQQADTIKKAVEPQRKGLLKRIFSK
jgi:hypothetical protein